MKDLFKDSDTKPFMITIVILLAIFIGCCMWFICMGKPADAKPAQAHYYALPVVVCGTDGAADLVACEDNSGNLWEFYGAEGWEIGDNASLLMSDNATQSVYDDIICGVARGTWIV